MMFHPWGTLAVSGMLCLLLSGIAHADLRSETLAMLDKLRQEVSATFFAEELRNLDATIATAEMYYQLNDQHNADRYYRLATQKGALLQNRIAQALPQASPETSVNPQPEPEIARQQQSGPTAVAEPVAPAQHPPALTYAPPREQPEAAQQVSRQDIPVLSDKLVGSMGSYTVARNDTLRLVAAKLGVNHTQLAAMNGLTPSARLKIGQVLRFNNQRIIPASTIKNGIVINIPDRMLYYFEKGALTYATAVALGTPTKMDDIPWHTPTGRFRITNKDKDPTWTVPPSIQEKMRREGKEVITSVPPGADNPLGKYALRTSLPGILIHSTSKPWSIYTFASHGCIRVYPERMEELFKVVKINTPGEIIYKPVKVVSTEEGRIFLEVHGDIYAKTRGIKHETKALLRSLNISDKVDWGKVEKVISRKSGIAEEITLDLVEAQQQEILVTNEPQSPS